MSANSGITVSPELSSAFSEAVTSQSVRFLKISIRNESLVPDESIPPSGTFDEDLDKLADLLEDDTPAYVLVRQDNPPTDWLAVFYVPDNAKVRDKMLYAATRSSLTKSLGSAPFSDSLFATSKADLGASAYAKHRASLAAPKPMSAREKEMEEIKAAETRSSTYNGSRDRVAHVQQDHGPAWSDEVEAAVKDLGHTEESKLVILTLTSSEALQVHSVTEVAADDLGSAFPPTDPCFAFFAWVQPSRRDIVYLYSCPSGSPIRSRMLYSCSTGIIGHHARQLLELRPSQLLTRRIETSNPKELNEAYLKADLASALGEETHSAGGSGFATPVEPEKKPFARPKGPVRKR